MKTEKWLELVAETVDGKLQVCDDGYVICCQNGKVAIDFLYGEDGSFQQMKECGK